MAVGGLGGVESLGAWWWGLWGLVADPVSWFGRTIKEARMALVSADTRISELLSELHQLIKQTQEERSRSEHNLVNIQKTHERMQTENKISPYYRTKLRGLYTTAKADAEAECNILRRSLDKIAEIKSLLEERRIAAKIAGQYHDSEPPRKTMRRGVLMTLLQQSAMTLPLWIGKPGEKPPPLCGAIPASSDYVAKPGDKVAARVKAVDGDEQWILAEVVSYSHAANKYEVDDIDEEGKERHTLSRRRIIPLPQWKANPETDPEALFQKDQLVLALYPQTTCFYRALIHTPPQRSQHNAVTDIAPTESAALYNEGGQTDVPVGSISTLYKLSQTPCEFTI
uniref:SGF29 C-terminal domain-containing protein n=1 Tax=Leptobrachium leishanense TaxID=445787 RepID=A0A8C5QDY4_9ANUR